MKRMISIIAVAALTFALTACGGSSQAATDTQAAENSTPAAVEEQKETVEAAEQTEAQPEAAQEAAQGQEQEAAQETAAEPASETPAAAHSDVLVAYFSATGTTKGVAERIASVTGGDLYEILAAEPYTEADLNYNDNSSRSTSEQNDKSVRPEIGSEDISLEGYTTIYLGFPIWWGEEPRILDTFVEKYNFDGITVIPFCTSGGSGVGRSDTALHKNVSGDVKWAKGKQINRANETEIRRWLDNVL